MEILFIGFKTEPINKSYEKSSELVNKLYEKSSKLNW